MAPGTVGMHSATSNRRRSRLNPTTYSMCCQAPRMPPRLLILVLPETAPILGSANGWIRARTVSGSKTVSPSTMTIRSWLAAWMHVFGVVASAAAAAVVSGGDGDDEYGTDEHDDPTEHERPGDQRHDEVAEPDAPD